MTYAGLTTLRNKCVMRRRWASQNLSCGDDPCVMRRRSVCHAATIRVSCGDALGLKPLPLLTFYRGPDLP